MHEAARTYAHIGRTKEKEFSSIRTNIVVRGTAMDTTMSAIEFIA